MIPTIENVMKCYTIIARSERMKCGRPGETTVQNTLKGSLLVCKAAGVSVSEPVSAITRQMIDAALVSFIGRGVSRISAWSYVGQLRALFARWCRPYYKDCGWEIPEIDMPTFRVQPPRYCRPSQEMLRQVRLWYQQLDGELWFAATMMLEFAMRNGDVLRLKDENFVEKGGVRYLSYTPHKTALSSGRRVFWPVHPEIWSRFDDMARFDGMDLTSETFEEMNRQMRAIGFVGSKASYELRKICIDHVYQKFGAEMAVSISGDDIQTITHYYADPAQPNIGAVRIVDLI